MSINIINRALIKVGQPLISSTNQEPNGKIMGMVYEDMRDFLIADYPWRFSLKRVVLAPDEEPPVSGFAYAYTLPSDFLALYRFGDYFKMPNYSNQIVSSDERYSIEGNKILCNVPSALKIVYSARIEDPALFSVCFKEALIVKIAAEISMRLKQSAQLQNNFNNEFAALLERAEFNDEILRDAETVPDGSWVGIREGWTNEY